MDAMAQGNIRCFLFEIFPQPLGLLPGIEPLAHPGTQLGAEQRRYGGPEQLVAIKVRLPIIQENSLAWKLNPTLYTFTELKMKNVLDKRTIDIQYLSQSHTLLEKVGILYFPTTDSHHIVHKNFP